MSETVLVGLDRLGREVRDGVGRLIVLPTNVCVTAATQRPMPIQPGYRFHLGLDNGPLSPAFGPRAVTMHFNTSA